MKPPEDPTTIRRLMKLCQETIRITGDTETVKRLRGYADGLRLRLERLKRGAKLNNGHP